TSPPEWTRLEFHQCSGCPLAATETPHCPAAVRLASTIDRFADVVSFDRIDVIVETDERTVSTRTSAQQGLASLIGLVLASSGCPQTAVFRPMARFHLPFSSEVETAYRIASMYLMAQHFAAREGKQKDLDLKDLALVYRGVHQVNVGLVQRLRAATHQDAIVNAVVLLDVYTSLVPAALEEMLDEVRPAFSALLSQAPRQVPRMGDAPGDPQGDAQEVSSQATE
ncbi:MAG TPA: hypothetical protein VK629_09650, partial [Steroidobacteraceae bacterium]|nr:hypothetical protein [Steroidobacteraceae bacterium]